jgi:CRP/FNR family cyclic AMP-dependent transcriptional regulator
MGIVHSSVEERVELLQKINSPYYRGLDESQLRQIAEPARLIEAHAGEFLYHQGQPAIYSYLLLSGRAIIVKFIKPGLAFPISYPRATARYLASAQAATAVRALRWEMRNAWRVLQAIPRVALNSIAVLTETLMDFVEAIGEYACGSAEERLLRMVRRLAEDLRENDHAALPITQQELAASTGLSLYTVNRILRSWEKGGLVEKQRHLLIVYPSKLRASTDIQLKIV